MIHPQRRAPETLGRSIARSIATAREKPTCFSRRHLYWLASISAAVPRFARSNRLAHRGAPHFAGHRSWVPGIGHRGSFPARGSPTHSSVIALPQAIQEWTRGRLSLRQIRLTARLNRGKLSSPVSNDNRHVAAVPSLQQVARDWRRTGITVESRLRLSSLVEKQKSLLQHLAKMRQQTETSLRKILASNTCGTARLRSRSTPTGN